ncbi:universal stress protein [Actinotalea sp. K2]|uniref:universal stress protein n=1 Tax=Actinotalea sp. K2 TaxID=2939438 RepID=UPI002016C6A2|nr:universal stress protein [Actinotalea sp. K2]MCL3862182.1 universal stress protein [Actinotalea sp. K2]
MTVVVGYVATPEGRAALAAGRQEAATRSARLVVVLSERGHRFGSDQVDLGTQEDELREQLDKDDLPYEIRQTSRGRDVADDLISTATDTGAQLIVIGLRRRSPVGKLILGSNAQRILLDAPCAVLAVKPQPT